MPTPIHPSPPVAVRPVRAEEHAAVAALTADVYLREGWADEEYAAHLRDVAGRAATSTVLVAVDGPRVVGALTVATRGGPMAEMAAPGEAVVRMLVVDPAARGRGVGRALVGAALDLARADGCRLVRLSTQPEMAAAHRVYASYGFRRTPARDWSPGRGVQLLTYALPLVPWCDQCGQALEDDGAHARCTAGRDLEPPRYCPHCRRRMVVQVLPDGWTARCVEHGTTTGG